MAKILIVEDDPTNREVQVRRMQWAGYQVITAANGLEGVKFARSEHPNLILMDMSIPIMDGWEATRRLKSSPVTRHIPIIALTAHAVAGDREKCLAAGCDEYESKPIKFPELMAKINKILGIQET